MNMDNIGLWLEDVRNVYRIAPNALILRLLVALNAGISAILLLLDVFVTLVRYQMLRDGVSHKGLPPTVRTTTTWRRQPTLASSVIRTV